MKSSSRGLLFALAVVVVLAAAVICNGIIATCRRCATRARELFEDAVPHMPRAGELADPLAPVVQVLRAVAYRVRRLKRDVMDIQPGYRRCPSV